jgi:thiamine-phosphate pyrophosphorylase
MRLSHARGFYFITDSGMTRQGALLDAEGAIRGGAVVVQYREKSKPYEQMAVEGKRMLALCRGANVPLIINDHLELALEVGADGLHIGPQDMAPEDARRLFPDGILGVSCSSQGEALRAEAAGADYIAASPVFFTPTKSFDGYGMREPLGIAGVGALRRATALPLAAIGGINIQNAPEILEAGADMLCAISATVATDDVPGSVRKFAELIKSHGR